ncbi:cupin domain-containing protein [Marinagarivorans cellulosilyticus]|uniref:(S)-ureidoglycine aminohydrolase cupin domain-containing protein n=1 Tax=Marinagarivorans cellulosilyticus TaxID=2721545 RepID=A0AAN1WLL1_9GAMM|nr:cupin domain-containing protein [Marinagarivorans cellulosilyticus]BCD99830.1 hypothetical protein MARGE09_P4032 [Marinagarivorans cellulosilyticus]
MALLSFLSKPYHKINALIFSRRSQFEMGDSTSKEGMEGLPFHPANVLEGDPQMRAKTLCLSGDGGFMTGLWDCTQGRFMWYFKCDEVVHILEGEVIVTVGDKTERLVKGSVAFFPIGTASEWHVPNYVFKLFSHRNPTPTAKRLFG